MKREYTEQSPAKNSCVKCRFEKTCGYSPLAMTGKHREYGSYGPCCLGKKSNGKNFFELRFAV